MQEPIQAVILVLQKRQLMMSSRLWAGCHFGDLRTGELWVRHGSCLQERPSHEADRGGFFFRLYVPRARIFHISVGMLAACFHLRTLGLLTSPSSADLLCSLGFSQCLAPPAERSHAGPRKGQGASGGSGVHVGFLV